MLSKQTQRQYSDKVANIKMTDPYPATVNNDSPLTETADH